MKSYQPQPPASWTDYEVDAIRTYAQENELRHIKSDNPLIYFRTKHQTTLLKHIDDVVEMYEAAYAPAAVAA